MRACPRSGWPADGVSRAAEWGEPQSRSRSGAEPSRGRARSKAKPIEERSPSRGGVERERSVKGWRRARSQARAGRTAYDGADTAVPSPEVAARHPTPGVHSAAPGPGGSSGARAAGGDVPG